MARPERARHFFYAAGSSGVDPDAAAFLAAQGNTDPAQTAALDALVKGLKSASLYSLFFTIYPFIGGSASAHKFNLIDPRNTDDAFRITWTGAATHSATGVQTNGSDAYGDTHFDPSDWFALDNGSFGFYRRSDYVGSGYDLGCSDALDVNSTSCIARYSGGNQFAVYGNVYKAVSNADAKGMYTTNILGSSNIEGYKDGVQVINDPAGVSLVLPSSTMTLGAQNRGGGAVEYVEAEYAFAFQSQGMTEAQSLTLYNLVQAFQVALGRSV